MVSGSPGGGLTGEFGGNVMAVGCNFTKTTHMFLAGASSLALLAGAALIVSSGRSAAADATWKEVASDNNLFGDVNWSTDAVPNSGDTAFFSQSSFTNLSNNAFLFFGGWTFNSDSPAYIITNDTGIYFDGAGVNVNGGSVTIKNIGTAGTIEFQMSSTAGNATIENDALLNFVNSSTAGNATIENTYSTYFYHSSKAGDATITNSGTGASTIFGSTSSAGSSTITNSGSGSGSYFYGNSTAGNAALIGGHANSYFDFTYTSGPNSDGQISAGSIAGLGAFRLGANSLTVGSNNQSTQVDGTISGPGSLAKVGTGTLTLNGTNTYSGSTTVSAGTLNVGGSLLGNVVVENGGTLSGIGSVPWVYVKNGGTFAPGNSIGKMTVGGNFTLDPGATYEVELNDAGYVAGVNNDLVTANAAILGAGSIIHVTPENGTDDGSTYAPGTDYEIISASFQLLEDGAGPTITDDFAFLDFTGRAHGLSYYLTSSAPASSFCQDGATSNQCQAGEAIKGLGSGNAIYDAVVGMNEADANAAFDAASGEVHASGQTVVTQTTSQFSQTLRNQAASGIGSGSAGRQATTAPLGYGPEAEMAKSPASDAIDQMTTASYAHERVSTAWITAMGATGSIDTDGNAGQLDWNAGGIAGGYEGAFDAGGGKAWAGLGFGYVKSRGTVDARSSSIDADNLQLGVYAGWANGPWTVTGALAYTASRIDSARNISVGGFTGTAAADYWTHSLGFTGEAAYSFGLGDGLTISPLATLDAGWSGHGGFAETGAGAFNLTSGSADWTRFDTGLGAAISRTVHTASGAALTFDARAVWEHAFSDVLPRETHALSGGAVALEVAGADSGRDRLRLGAGAAFQISQDMTVRASYDGIFSSSQTSHTGNLSLSVKF